jgi:ribosomal-protein-alanine N-acetyltransferase
MMIRTARYALEILRRDDQAAQNDILEIFNHPQFEKFMGLGPHNPEGNKTYIDRALAMNEDETSSSCIMAIKDNGKTIGVMDIAMDEGAPDLGYFISPDHWSKGIAKECLHPFVDHLFKTKPIFYMKATCLPDNVASAKLLRSIGFVQTGRKERSYGDGAQESLTWELSRDQFFENLQQPPKLEF